MSYRSFLKSRLCLDPWLHMAAMEVVVPIPDPVLPVPEPSPSYCKRSGRNAATQAPEKAWNRTGAPLATAGAAPKTDSDCDSNYHSSDSPGRSRTSKDRSGTATPVSESSQPLSGQDLAKSQAFPSKHASTAELEAERSEMQRSTEKWSLLIMLPSLGLLLLSPWFLLPIFTVPSAATPVFVMLLLVGCPLAGLVLTLGCLMGNVVWYHDPEDRKLKWGFHCGKRFRDHFFAEELFHKYKKKLVSTERL